MKIDQLTVTTFIDNVLRSRLVPWELYEQFAAIRKYRSGEDESAVGLDILRRLEPWLQNHPMLHERCLALMATCAANIEKALEREAKER